MQRIQNSILAAAWPALLLLSHAAHAQAPLCCTAGQTRMECLEQREMYWNNGVVCRDPAPAPFAPASGGTLTTAPAVRSPAVSLLPSCCSPGQNRMECLEQRERNWTQGIACQDLPAAPQLSNSAGSSPPSAQGVARASSPDAARAIPPATAAAGAGHDRAGDRAAAEGVSPAVNAKASAPVALPAAQVPPAPALPGTVPQSSPPRVSAVAGASAAQGTSATGAVSAQGKAAATTPVASPLPAKSNLPLCCTKGQSKMDCLEQRERSLTMGIACQLPN